MVFIQNLIILCRKFSEEERLGWMTEGNSNTSWNTLQDYIVNILRMLDNTCLLNVQANAAKSISWHRENVEEYVKAKCLPFLKVSSLLQYYLYDKEVSLINFVNLFFFFINYNFNFMYNNFFY